jgi:uroporphyrinogen-III decarboxylase
MDMKKAKKLIGDTVCLMGNLPYELLVYGTKEKIEDYTKRLIDEAAPGGGFIMSADKIFGENINPKCMSYWCEAVIKYGKY